jgi:hypothetical protein
VEVVNSGIFVYTANGTRLLMNTLPNFLGGSELWGGLLNGDAPSPSDPRWGPSHCPPQWCLPRFPPCLRA